MNGDVKFWNGADVAETITTTADAQRMPDKNRLQAVVEVDFFHCKMGGVSMTIAANAGSERQQHVICYDARGNGDGDTACTITGDHPNRVTDYTPLCAAIAENIIGRQVQNGGNGTGAQEELAYTQNATGVMGVAMNTFVRRLMPIECERLMGFPDNWTRIVVKRYKNKPTSKRFEQVPENFEELENGEWVEYAADSVRYKACGNSMCVNVMRWIGEQIDRVDKLTE